MTDIGRNGGGEDVDGDSGFIGLGNMGLPMAINLGKAITWCGFDLSGEATTALAAAGGTVAEARRRQRRRQRGDHHVTGRPAGARGVHGSDRRQG